MSQITGTAGCHGWTVTGKQRCARAQEIQKKRRVYSAFSGLTLVRVRLFLLAATYRYHAREAGHQQGQ
jgi:hypothetical protein